jgi:hypothetical protein
MERLYTIEVNNEVDLLDRNKMIKLQLEDEKSNGIYQAIWLQIVSQLHYNNDGSEERSNKLFVPQCVMNMLFGYDINTVMKAMEKFKNIGLLKSISIDGEKNEEKIKTDTNCDTYLDNRN